MNSYANFDTMFPVRLITLFFHDFSTEKEGSKEEGTEKEGTQEKGSVATQSGNFCSLKPIYF